MFIVEQAEYTVAMCITDVCAGRGFLYTTGGSHLSPKRGNSKRHFYFSSFKGRKQEENLNPLQGCIKSNSFEAWGSLACNPVYLEKNQGMRADANSLIYVISRSWILTLLAPTRTFEKR